MALSKDIVLNDAALKTAADDMEALKRRTEDLKQKLKTMYHDLTTALDTPAGKELEFTAESVLIEPIDKMLLVIDHISDTLNEVKGKGYYKDVFDKFERLNQNIKFN